jgi:hypothetical protein
LSLFGSHYRITISLMHGSRVDEGGQVPWIDLTHSRMRHPKFRHGDKALENPRHSCRKHGIAAVIAAASRAVELWWQADRLDAHELGSHVHSLCHEEHATIKLRDLAGKHGGKRRSPIPLHAHSPAGQAAITEMSIL